MSQSVPSLPSEEANQVPELVTQKFYRNFYSALLLSAIHDLERYRDLKKIPKVQHQDIRLYRRRTLAWFRNHHRAAVSFQQCLDALGMQRKSFLIALKKAGLLPCALVLPCVVPTEVEAGNP